MLRTLAPLTPFCGGGGGASARFLSTSGFRSTSGSAPALPAAATLRAALALYLAIFAVIFFPSPCNAEFSIDDAALFRVNFNKQGELLYAPDLETIVMTTSNKEQYECTLPKLRSKFGEGEPPYDGPNALGLLEKLFVQSSCAYRLEHYWTYELCHGRYLRQFHEERDGKNIKVQEYYLGRFSKDDFDRENLKLTSAAESGLPVKPLRKKIDNLNLPYYQLLMGGGTLCDLTGKPRVTRANYVCYPKGKHEMYSFKESSTCEYDVVVLSPLLCQHPDYRPDESVENMVSCQPASDKFAYKPLNLVKAEAESLHLRTQGNVFEAEIIPGTKPGQVKIEIKPVRPGAEDVDDDVDGAASPQSPQDDKQQQKNWHEAKREPFKPLMDHKIVQDFLMGEYCLYGGSGWWKYEFCYGKRVIQYHEEKGSDRVKINLGTFDRAKHLAWVQANPAKRPKPVHVRKFVSHFYSDGDVCDVTGNPRQLEVKLKCKKSESPSTVSLYLLEPKTCEYILGVESPLVCDILHLADDDGLIDLDRDSFDKPDQQEGESLRPEATSHDGAATADGDVEHHLMDHVEEHLKLNPELREHLNEHLKQHAEMIRNAHPKKDESESAAADSGSKWSIKVTTTTADSDSEDDIIYVPGDEADDAQPIDMYDDDDSDVM